MASWSWTASATSAALAVALTGCAARVPLPSYSTVPEFTLTDQTGAVFDSAPALKGHVWIADFMFTNCPGPCPRMSHQMEQVQNALAGTDARIVSLSIDPAHDTPPVLRKYAEYYSAKPGVWFFLTGDVATLQKLDHDVFKLGEIDGSLDHSTRFVLVDRNSQVRGYYATEEPDAVKRVVADAKLLLKETS